GVTDLDELAEAWQRAVDRTPILRTSIHWESLDEPIQLVHKDFQLPINRIDWRGLPDEEQQRELEAMLAAEGAEGVDLRRPPLRLTLIRLTDSSVRLLWTLHHILIDGW